MQLYDISLPISPKTLIYPLNPRVSLRWVKTPHSWLTKTTLGTHTGTHVDVARHVFKNGWGVDAIRPKVLIGPCRVLDLTRNRKAIFTKDLLRHRIKTGERILVKTTNSKRGFSRFYRNYVYLDGDAAAYMAKKKIALFGIDYLSVKQYGSSDNRPHTELLKQGIPIFEGLDLSKVSSGTYIFVGLPLKLVGRDGAPTRVVLIR
ncbi:MAG: hypothetical protein A2806_02015 [Candidatus Terrybacteria bacterium RIFCSPHIGHO2_01_FULL_48_17]|uniref:Cyclase n=1 Tax=Candidatus Terrybacteria bacterium RIFCSPHIGHO2_01_FULL_48_17 TaxID=1802362 RepID=A0A1G2PMX0_9BACT|nr:MAG: hypothetical protein A2806_02015 [Candidatus Terrybacteria bacterium RIFCSPHIGHO2_01_FULL_48_17]OHA52626.1 MAG: hypothetical protein A3A30_03280 [Candidatus Terrybacteria bacterium RIFCSPLOWO2_01_FULL_48_14]